MIRINLLSEGRRPVVARKAKPTISLGGQDPNNLLLVAGLVVGAVIVGAIWYLKNGELTEAKGKVSAAQAEFAKLEPIIKQVDEFKKKKANIEAKVAVIKDLKRKQQGPVAIMDNVSRALPDLVWLDNMSVSGTSVTLRGKAFNTNAVATFIENLDKVPEFREPDAKDIQASGGGQAQVYSFQISFGYELAPAPEESDEAAASEVSQGP